MTEHEQYHELTISLLQTNADILREIAIITNAMLAVFVVAGIAIIWTLNKK